MNLPRRLTAFLITALLLSACSNFREDLGLGRAAPDEFAVADRPPLALPPDFGLRPPKPGAPRPQDIDLTQRASDTLFAGNTSIKTAAAPDGEDISPSEKVLLEQTNANKADPNIRDVVDREDSAKVVANPHLVDELLWWKKDEKPTPTVDAVAEAARIKEAKQKGEPLNQGATPVIEREKSGWLGL